MNKFFRATCLSILGLAAASGGFLACSSDNNTTTDGGPGTGDGGNVGEGGGGEGGSGDGGGGDGAITTAPVGRITLTQSNVSNNYFHSVSASFAAAVAAAGGAGTCTTTMMGSCTATVCAVVDGGAPAAVVSGLNAGDITVTGMADAGAAVLTYGAIGDAGYKGYHPASGVGQFFNSGDMISAMGAGGPDLPAFTGQMVTAPSDIVMTSPACDMTGCPDLDRTADLAVTWTGGTVGKVNASLASISDASVVSIQCTFDAAGGTGTIPSAILGKLEKAGDPGITGFESFNPKNEGAPFMVGTAPTTISVQAQGAQAALTVSN